MRPHRFPCSDPDCLFCEGIAESRAEDDSPDFDEDAAADQYERSVGL
jgi:hypothetical protein